MLNTFMRMIATRLRQSTVFACFFLLAGCGPSEGEKKVQADLVEAQKQLAVSTAELKMTQDSLTQAQSDATTAQAKIHDLEEEIIKNQPAPECEVNGEVFIATQGGSNFRLGMVEVMVFERSKIDAILVSRKKENDQLRSVLGAQGDKLGEEARKALNAYFAASGAEKAGLLKIMNDKESAFQAFSDHGYAEINSGAFYFETLPEPVLSVKTNADGKFKFSIPRGSSMVVAARATRSVGGSTEHYFWMIPVPSTSANSIDITLSNDNLASVKGGSLFYSMEDR